MATVNGIGQWVAKRVHKMSWEGLANGDDGSPLTVPRLSDKTVQVTGTFGAGGQVSVEGSNDGGATWSQLSDPQGDPLQLDAEGIETILDNVESIRPRVTAGDGTTDLAVTVVSRGDR